MKSQWKQNALFEDQSGVVLDVKLHLNQEAQTIGLWAAVRKTKGKIPESEIVAWHPYSVTGVSEGLIALWELLQEVEGVHGIELPMIEDLSSLAPF